MPRLLAALAALLCVSTCGDSRSDPLPANIAADAYALYSSIYRSSKKLGPGEVIGIKLDIDPFPEGTYCVTPHTAEEKTLLEHALWLGRERHIWEPKFDFGRPYKLLTEAEAAKATRCRHIAEEGCEPYRNIRYVRYLSAPGFNANHTRALVWISRVCGGLCGDGGVSVYRKTGDKWEFEENSFAHCIWVY